MEEACEVCIFVALWLDSTTNCSGCRHQHKASQTRSIDSIQVTQQTLAFLKMCGVKHWSNNNNRKKKEDAEKLQCLFGD